MGNKSTDHERRRQMRARLLKEGVPEPEIVRRLEVMRIRQAERRAEQRAAGGQTVELTSEIADLVAAARAIWRDHTEGNRERLHLALEPFDGVL